MSGAAEAADASRPRRYLDANRPVIPLIALIAVVGVLVWVVPAIATTVARTVLAGMDRSPTSGSIDQSLVEARLGRIEEAIDAMAVQIERLTEQQRAFIGAPANESVDAGSDPTRTETPQ